MKMENACCLLVGTLDSTLSTWKENAGVASYLTPRNWILSTGDNRHNEKLIFFVHSEPNTSRSESTIHKP